MSLSQCHKQRVCPKSTQQSNTFRVVLQWREKYLVVVASVEAGGWSNPSQVLRRENIALLHLGGNKQRPSRLSILVLSCNVSRLSCQIQLGQVLLTWAVRAIRNSAKCLLYNPHLMCTNTILALKTSRNYAHISGIHAPERTSFGCHLID